MKWNFYPCCLLSIRGSAQREQVNPWMEIQIKTSIHSDRFCLPKYRAVLIEVVDILAKSIERREILGR